MTCNSAGGLDGTDRIRAGGLDFHRLVRSTPLDRKQQQEGLTFAEVGIALLVYPAYATNGRYRSIAAPGGEVASDGAYWLLGPAQ